MYRIQRIVLYVFFFSINFEMWDPFNTGGYFSIAKLLGFIYLVVMIPSIINFRTPEEYKPALKSILLFYMVLTIISAFNIKPEYSNFLDLSILQNIVLFWILVNHENSDNLILEKSMLSFGMGSITLAILFSMGIGIEFDPIDSRTTIFGENANNVGINMSISLIILFLTLIQNRLGLRRFRYLLIAGIPFLFITMIGTGSRVSFLAFLLAFLGFISLYKSKNKWGKPVVIVFGVFALFFIWQYFLKSEEITLRLIRSLQEGDLSNREIIWKAVFPIWLENPFFGIGTTGYEHLSFSTYGRFVSPHNVILEILCISGIAGLLLYLIFLYRVSLIGYNTFRTYNYLLPVLILIPIWGYLLSAQLLRVKFGWIIFAYVVANSIYVTRKEKSKSFGI